MKEKEKITGNENKKQTGDVTRRDFLVGAGTVVVGGAIGAGLLSSCKGETTTVTQTTTKTVPTTVTAAATTITETSTTTVGGEGAVTVTTTVNEGGVVPAALEPEETLLRRNRQISCIDIKNGKFIRQRPLHYDSKYSDLENPWTISARGKTWTAPMKTTLGPQSLAFRPLRDNPMRILYPLKRVDWEPGGDPEKINPQNRGKSKYKRISWDEASTIIAGELTRVAENYGTSAIGQLVRVSSWGFGLNIQGDGFSIAPFLHYYLMSKYDGNTFTERHYTADSHVGGICGVQFFWGTQASGYEDHTGVLNDVANNAEMVLGWGCDSLTRSFVDANGTMSGTIWNWFKELGIKRIFICPDLNKGAGIHNDKWVPVLPNTDGALALAIAYVWINEDIYDKDYIANHAYGFDKWQAYVMGDEDGIAKTPEWASPLCGVPTWTIKALAREWASKATSISFGWGGNGGGVCRGSYGPDHQRLQAYLLGMQTWGAPGRHNIHGTGDPGADAPPSISSVGGLNRLYTAMYMKFGKTPTAADTDKQFFPENMVHRLPDASPENPVEWWAFETPFIKRTYPMEGFSEIHMVWSGGSHWTYSWGGGNEKLKSLRSPKLECIVNQHMFMEDTPYYADIILPIVNGFECGEDIVDSTGPFHTLAYLKDGLKPLGESKSDRDAIGEVAKKLGFYEEFSEGKTDEEWVEQGFQNSGWTDLASFEDLKEKGYICQPVGSAWTSDPKSLAFYQDPVKNPLRTPTGLLEYESSQLFENFPDDKERNPVAHYVTGGLKEDGWSHNEDLLSERAATYPLLMTAPTPGLGRHGMLYNVPWLRELQRTVYHDGYSYASLWMNRADAEARGIEDGDLVRFYNERGSVLACASVSEKIMNGAVQMPKGGGDDAIIPEALNRGGNPNSICPVDNNSIHVNGICVHNFLVEVEKVTGEQMDEWRSSYPEAFERDYDPAFGPSFRNRVVEEGGE